MESPRPGPVVQLGRHLHDEGACPKWRARAAPGKEEPE
jgi:hypothetical protein